MRLTAIRTVRNSCALLLLSLPCIIIAYAQDPYTPSPAYAVTIDTILVSGNTSTQNYVIINEMTIRPGSAPSAEAFQYDRARIYSLGLFTRVDLFLDTLGAKQALRVVVNERWHYFPVPIFGFRDGDPGRPYYGGGFMHNNFRGRNQKLFGSLIFGYNPSAQISFYEPLIDATHRLSFSTAASFSRVRNRSAIEASATGDFDELHYDLSAGVGKRLSLFEMVSLSLAYQVIDVSVYRPLRTVSPSGVDRFLSVGAGYSYDSRDLREYAARGHYVGLSVNRYGLGTSDVSFMRFGADLRTYFPLNASFTLAGRVTGSLVAGGTVPTYARQYFGYGERIRGYFKTIVEGENLFGSSVELRFSLLPVRVFRMPGTFLPDEFTVWQFGISLALFADAGTTWFRHEPVALAGVLSGYGGGIRFLLPYGIVARTEYAINNHGKGQFIFDFRTPF
jgi:outer membrane protein assembly factor BamA